MPLAGLRGAARRLTGAARHFGVVESGFTPACRAMPMNRLPSCPPRAAVLSPIPGASA
ncbi:hypothetical protein STPYR_12146 [uncultured Stenotrophomonas sp.]|uniref:Uncharacterized protein n=1 Tax=uncultured Stenotrophomonas sp. TaxID=165438 RepID=A0A1Y5Q847_9GAMM|nr:hypothetical protein STPYR_12146 [uncultured Stenotrophomonas sp.]